MSKRAKKSPQKSSAPAVASLQPPPTQKRNVELFMECVDEDLAPSQKEAELKAETEYQSAVQHVQSVKPPVTNSARRGRPPGTRNVASAGTAAAVARGRGSSGRGRGRGIGMAVASGRLTKCIWLIVSSCDISKPSSLGVPAQKFCCFLQ